MGKKLVIVESPAKTKAIEKYLGEGFKVVSSKGHIRDLATSGEFGFGVDIEDNFKPNYRFISGKKVEFNKLKKDSDTSDFVYLATDPDREGEAISWHLYDALELTPDNYERVVFNEITKDAVLKAFETPRKIDQDLVNSQETRRILDRIIGFRLSKIVQQKTDGKSAGRVQSVALLLIVDKEKIIDAFIPEEYWSVDAVFKDITAALFNFDNKELELVNEKQVNEILANLDDKFLIDSIESKTRNKKSRLPYKTSTLQQDGSNKLFFNSRKTMSVAQKLYEGIDIGSETVGLITYMRTDSTRLSDSYIKSGYAFINDKYGKEYVGFAKQVKQKDNVQDAHEGIRPTDVNRTPELIKRYLTDDEFKLYKMIYSRALASLMADAKTSNTTIIFDNNNYQFKATGQVIVFEGYLKIYSDYEDTKEQLIPDYLVKGDYITASEIIPEQHFTKPPARYTEATLIKEMEELGIGRPSTYAATMTIIRNRSYVTMEGKSFKPTDIGIDVSDKLQVYFNKLINVKYTANMENDLDEIAVGNLVWYEVLDKFYKEFAPVVDKAMGEMAKKEPEKTGEICPQCGGDLVVRVGRFGKFVACGNFPECKYIKNNDNEESKIVDCPNCEVGSIVEKRTRRGKIFYGCNNYPDCKTAYWDKPIDKRCDKCNGLLVIKKDEEVCPECTKPVKKPVKKTVKKSVKKTSAKTVKKEASKTVKKTITKTVKKDK